MAKPPFYLGSQSLLSLQTCHWDIQCLVQEAIKRVDFTVICGFRDKKEQNMAFNCGASKLNWPNSRHNSFPSSAFDILPYPFTSWKDISSFLKVIDGVKIAAARLDIKIICGADWDWKDYGHVELS